MLSTDGWSIAFLVLLDHTIADASQDSTGLLGHLDTLAHVQLAVVQNPRSFSIRKLSKHCPQPAMLRGVVTQGQDLALSLVEPLAIVLSPSIQPVQGYPVCPGHPSRSILPQLGVVSKLTEVALDYLTWVVDENIK
ncbi:hypothetical protein DUI87_09989 [Hirundo rustica rustica]|uniref:Uncharacterized protein n=1 Tax=Hirundo rustica rustica TaxID=333673 RepID=A0A3M0KGZ1_HIRRU|nr:hypothetical protein DUI87_09989 [Hirundo rustica rustica]